MSANPFDLILSELAELRIEVRKIRIPETPTKLPDNLTVDQALSLLADNGYPTTKANLYKMSAISEIPCSRIGKRLVFSRKTLLNWVESLKVEKLTPRQKASNQLSKR